MACGVFLGIADIEVRTAGGGGPSSDANESGGADMHLAYFRGVDNANEIRDSILARVRQLRDSGLGDPDADERPVAQLSSAAVSSARSLLEEVQALRRSFAGMGRDAG